MRKYISIFLISIFIIYFGLGYYVYSQAVATTCSVYEPEAKNAPDSFSLGEKANWNPSKYFVSDYEDVEIKTEDGITLSGWYMESDPGAITIIGMHGVTSSKFSPDVLLVGGMLYNEGFNYLTFDFRDHGTSTCEDSRHSAGQKEIYDVKASIEWLKNEKNIPTSNIGIYGASFGAMIGLMTPAVTNDFQALAVVDSPFDFASLVSEELVYQGFPGFLFQPVYHYALIFDQINLTEISPDDGLAASNKQPLLICTSGGGMRMQASMISLSQMPRSILAINELKKHNLPYLVLFTDPTAGGITASYAMVGDIHIAEPGALIAFAGARVIQGTVNEQLPPGFQKSEYLEKSGFVDLIVDRKDLSSKIGTLLSILLKQNSAISSEQNETSEDSQSLTRAAS